VVGVVVRSRNYLSLLVIGLTIEVIAIWFMLSSDKLVVEAPVVESSAIIFEEGELVEWETAPIYYDWNNNLIVKGMEK